MINAPLNNPKVDRFLAKQERWKEEMLLLRSLALKSKLTEDFKWGQPCYTDNGNNIVLIHGFKEYCAFLFFKGALLKDPKRLLVQQTANVQAARQVRFKNASEIRKYAKDIQLLIKQAIANERAGLKVEFKKVNEFPVVAEFESVLKKNARLKKAFAGLTPGRQRAYLLYFASAKQAQTREARVAKNIPLILQGKGLDD